MELKPYQFCGTGMLSHKIVVKGNCTVCGKPLGENDGLFLCAECQKKNNWCATCIHNYGDSCEFGERCTYQSYSVGTYDHDLPPTEYEEE